MSSNFEFNSSLGNRPPILNLIMFFFFFARVRALCWCFCCLMVLFVRVCVVCWSLLFFFFIVSEKDEFGWKGRRRNRNAGFKK